ncbi:MAG: hypothetical protein ACYS0H_26605 [Planctomycetota bacterium]|jgi:hypothetical protein
MNPMRRIAVLAVITLSIGLSAALSESKAESKAEKKIEDNFKVSWSSIDYTKRVSVRNPAVSQYGQQVQVQMQGRGQGQDVSESVSLSCEVEILDPNFVLGISRAPMIEEMTDDKGESIGISTRSSSSFQMRYEVPRYDRRFVAPQRQPKWKTAVRSALKLPPKESSRPRWVEEIRPSRMQIDLDVDLSKRTAGEIGRVEGHFYALVAESYENIDVPFKPSDKWVRLTPDMEIQLKEAKCTETGFRFSIKSRPQGGGSMRPLSVQDYVPNRIVTAREFIGEDGKPTDHFRGLRRLPAHITGSGSGGGSNSQIKSIRFVVAVNPTHFEIPFVLENIPLPKP